jgi:hypothetical protein
VSKRQLAIILTVAALLVPTVAYAQAASTEGLLLRAGGDVTVDANDVVETLIVLDGDATVRGTVDDVIVISGNATIENAEIRNLFVTNGDATLTGSTHVREDVRVVDGSIDRGANVTVDGSVSTGGEVGFSFALGIVSFLIYIGFSVALIVLALAIAAVAARQANEAGAAITRQTGAVALAALLFWILVPLAAIGAFITVIGIPTGLMILLMLMPAFAVLGYTVAGIRLGTWLLGARGDQLPTGHPYLAAAIGVAILQLVAWIPFIGFLVGTLAGLAGSGAIALLAWRALRRTPTPLPAEPPPAAAVG